MRYKSPGDRVTLTVRRGDEEKEIEAELAGADDFVGWARRARPRQPLSPRAWLGVQIAPESGRGVEVAAVFPTSPADLAGLRRGDNIIRVDKTRVEAPADLQMAIAKHKPGDTVQLAFERDGDRKEVKVELGAFIGGRGDVSELTEGEVRRMLRRFLEGRPPVPGELLPPTKKKKGPEKKKPKPDKAERREHIKKRIAELEKELERLKKQLSEKK